ncbi:MAG: hypothetical protein IBX62_00815 [Coriobacteriia bacterium]|nr:hypothetical protein [Coriobacteriia bacterium]
MEPRRLPHLLALVLVAAFIAPMLLDTAAMLRGRWPYSRIVPAGDSLENVGQASGGRNRFLNLYVGLAVRHVAGGAPSTVVVPEDLTLLPGRPPDVFGGVPQPALRLGLLRPMLADSVRVRAYDPRLSDAQVDALLSSGPVRELPWGVHAITSAGGTGDERRVVLLSDAEGERVFAAPLRLAPRGLLPEEER